MAEPKNSVLIIIFPQISSLLFLLSLATMHHFNMLLLFAVSIIIIIPELVQVNIPEILVQLLYLAV